MRVDFLFDGAAVERFDELLEGVQRRAVDATPVFEFIADEFLELERARFAGGAGWQPDTAEWTARKGREGRGLRTLVYTGSLERSLTMPRARYAVRNVSRQGATFGTRDPVVNLHRKGGGHLPKRAPVSVDDAVVARWQRGIGDYLLRGELFGRAGL